MSETDRSKSDEEQSSSENERESHHPTPGGLRAMV